MENDIKAEEQLVSVVIPTYKRAHIVSSAIQSVLKQSHHNLEVLVVDDCSPDDTEKVVQGIRDNRIRYIRHDVNKGLPAVRNTGIRAASGDYIAFLDDDDAWRADKLKKQLILLQIYDAVLCMGASNGYPMRVHKGESITLDDLKRGSFNPSSLVARSFVFRNIKFDENLRQGEDWDGFIQIAKRYSIGWVSEPLLIYNQNSADRMTDEKKNLSGPDLEKRAAMLYKHRKFFGEKWFKYHLAGALLAYIGSRENKVNGIQYAVDRCGLYAVILNIRDRILVRLQRRFWYLKWKLKPIKLSSLD
jgi:glycosyltransferase involved in cell wall biosynthesis